VERERRLILTVGTKVWWGGAYGVYSDRERATGHGSDTKGKPCGGKEREQHEADGLQLVAIIALHCMCLRAALLDDR